MEKSNRDLLLEHYAELTDKISKKLSSATNYITLSPIVVIVLFAIIYTYRNENETVRSLKLFSTGILCLIVVLSLVQTFLGGTYIKSEVNELDKFQKIIKKFLFTEKEEENYFCHYMDIVVENFDFFENVEKDKKSPKLYCDIIVYLKSTTKEEYQKITDTNTVLEVKFFYKGKNAQALQSVGI